MKNAEEIFNDVKPLIKEKWQRLTGKTVVDVQREGVIYDGESDSHIRNDRGVILAPSVALGTKIPGHMKVEVVFEDETSIQELVGLRWVRETKSGLMSIGHVCHEWLEKTEKQIQCSCLKTFLSKTGRVVDFIDDTSPDMFVEVYRKYQPFGEIGKRLGFHEVLINETFIAEGKNEEWKLIKK